MTKAWRRERLCDVTRKATVCLLALLSLGLSGGLLSAEEAPSGVQLPESFPDYHPKTTPDTLSDFEPALGSLVEVLPAPSAANLPVLVTLLKQLQLAAAQNPGRWEEGNPLLGARPHEYRPSTEELLVCEVGQRISAAVASGPTESISASLLEAGLTETEVEFRQFVVTHVDVMGSGRVFYIDGERTMRVVFPLRGGNGR